MTTKLNHKNGDKTLQEDLLSDKQEKIGVEQLKIFQEQDQRSIDAIDDF